MRTYGNRRIFRAALTAVTLVIALGCSGTMHPIDLYRRFTIGPDLSSVVHKHPGYLSKPYSLLVMIDRKACIVNLAEAKWWSDWEQFAKDKGIGFAFVTSKEDSDDVIISSRLDSCYAPVLVVPGSDTTISQHWTPLSPIPLKVLIDSTGSVYHMWFTINTPELSTWMLHQVDSLMTNKIPPIAETRIVDN